MAGAAAEGDVADGAELLVAHGADLADTTALVVVAHHPVAQLESRRGTGPQLLDDAAGLVAGDHVGGLGVAVTVQVGAAQSGGHYPQDGLSRSGVGVGKLLYFRFAVALEGYSSHISLPRGRNLPR